MSVDLNKATIEDIQVTFNEKRFSLGSLHYQKGWRGKQSGEIRKVEATWVHIKKKDSTHVDNKLIVDAITYEGKKTDIPLPSTVSDGQQTTISRTSEQESPSGDGLTMVT